MLKKLLLLLFFCLVIYLYFNNNLFKNNYFIKTNKYANINELYIYGTKFNLNGTIDKEFNSIKSIKLLINNSKKIEIDLEYNLLDDGVYFEISDKINDGFNLEKYDLNNSYLYIKIIDNDDNVDYFNLKNNTEYQKTDYYYIRNDNKLNIVTKNNTIYLYDEKANDKVYDIIIDPGHGGYDDGACGNGICETDYTYKISKEIKEILEKNNFSVKLSRDELDKDESIPNYGKNGRVNIINNSKAKYLISIHLNSNDYDDSGLEIYTPYNINYDFVSKIVKNIVDNVNTSYSTNNSFKIENGVYTRTLQNIDLKELEEDAMENHFNPYNVSLKTTYYFILRETGGYMSGAYKDGRDGKDYNFDSKSNVGREGYLLELGYVTSKKDVLNIKKNYKEYAKAIANSLIEEIR